MAWSAELSFVMPHTEVRALFKSLPLQFTYAIALDCHHAVIDILGVASA